MRKAKIKYFTAVGTKEVPFDTFSGEYIAPNFIAFTHDLNEGTHPEFRNADVIYADIPWERGYDKFTQGHTDKKYDEFLISVKRVIDDLKIPAYISCSKHALRILKPHKVMTVSFNQFNNYPVSIAIFYADEIKAEDECELLKMLADKYDTALDFCCGNGNTAETFISRGKKAIISDINGFCLKTAIEEMEKINEQRIKGSNA